jgi:hypothetical protein
MRGRNFDPVQAEVTLSEILLASSQCLRRPARSADGGLGGRHWPTEQRNQPVRNLVRWEREGRSDLAGPGLQVGFRLRSASRCVVHETAIGVPQPYPARTGLHSSSRSLVPLLSAVLNAPVQKPGWRADALVPHATGHSHVLRESSLMPISLSGANTGAGLFSEGT